MELTRADVWPLYKQALLGAGDYSLYTNAARLADHNYSKCMGHLATTDEQVLRMILLAAINRTSGKRDDAALLLFKARLFAWAQQKRERITPAFECLAG
jgi:hypothetical protein